MLLLIISEDGKNTTSNLSRVEELKIRNEQLIESPSLDIKELLRTPKKTLLQHATEIHENKKDSIKIQKIKEEVKIEHDFYKTIVDAFDSPENENEASFNEKNWIDKVKEVDHIAKETVEYFSETESRVIKTSYIYIIHQNPFLKQGYHTYLPWSVLVRLVDPRPNGIRVHHIKIKSLIKKLNIPTRLLENVDSTDYDSIVRKISEEKNRGTDIYEWADKMDEDFIEKNYISNNNRRTINNQTNNDNTAQKSNDTKDQVENEEENEEEVDDTESEKEEKDKEEKSSWYHSIFSWKSLGIFLVLTLVIILVVFPINLIFSI